MVRISELQSQSEIGIRTLKDQQPPTQAKQYQTSTKQDQKATKKQSQTPKTTRKTPPPTQQQTQGGGRTKAQENGRVRRYPYETSGILRVLRDSFTVSRDGSAEAHHRLMRARLQKYMTL